jgi:hypothetical protein
VSTSVSGVGFVDGASVKLVRAGEPDIVADPVAFRYQHTLFATFDLTGKPRGAWDVVVTNPNGASATLKDGFAIEEGVFPQVWTDVIGRSVLAVGRPQTLTFLVGNLGNIDTVGALLIRGIPPTAVVEVLDGALPERLESEDPDEVGYLFPSRVLPAGATLVAARMRLRLTELSPEGSFSLSALWGDN